jgi:hypothetical protein
LKRFRFHLHSNPRLNKYRPKTEDHQLAKFLKEKNLTPEETLNNHNLESLKTEFEQTQQTTQTVQPTTSPFNPNN